jgi:hypothetical protein
MMSRRLATALGVGAECERLAVSSVFCCSGGCGRGRVRVLDGCGFAVV